MSAKARNQQVQQKPKERSHGRTQAADAQPFQPTFNPLLGLQRTLGNQAVLRLFESGAVQAKLRVSQPGDADEIEADRVADQVTSSGREPSLQCKCSGGTPCSKCAEEEGESIHRSARTPFLHLFQTSIQRFPADQTPAPEPAGIAPRPATPGGRGATRPPLIVDDNAATLAPGQMKKSEFMAELRSQVCATADAALAAVGRSTKSCPYIEQWLAFYSTQDSAHIERAIHKYAPETARATRAQAYFSIINDRVRQAVTTWAKTGRITGVSPGVPLMPTPSGPPGAETSPGAGTEGGQGKDRTASPVTGVQGSQGEGAAGSSPSGQKVLTKRRDAGSAAGNKEEGVGSSMARASSGTRRAQLKERVGAAAPETDAESIRQQLGRGRLLDPTVRNRMESAFGSDFSFVRVHDDTSAWGLSSQLNARAFTIGSDIAFATGEYKPSTLVGDALIAHELAHVVQQGAATQSNAPMLKGDGDYDALEADADLSAVGAVASSGAGTWGGLSKIAHNVRPSLKSGLSLQRCTGEKCAEGHWEVVNRAQLAGACDCTWACVSSSSGPAIEDPYRVRPSNPSPRHMAGIGGQNPRTGEGMCYCLPLKDKDGNILGTDWAAPPNQDYTGAAAAAAGMTQGPHRAEDTTETKPPAAIHGSPTPGVGELEPVTPKTGEVPKEPPKVAQPPPAPVKPPEPVKPPGPPKAPEPVKVPEHPKPAEPAKPTEPTKAEPAEKKTDTPGGTTQTSPPAVSKAQRVQEIEEQLAKNSAEMQALDQKRLEALERERDASAQAARAEGAKRDALREKARRNRESAERLKNDRDELRIRNRKLLDERDKLIPGIKRPQTWQEAEDFLRKEFSGQKRTFVLPGGDRDVDCYTDDGIAREAKFGPQGLSEKRILVEIEKDRELLRTGAVKAVEWHFYENIDGKIGPSQPLRDALFGPPQIRIVMHNK